MKTSLDGRIIVLWKRRTRLSIEISRTVLFKKLSRFDLLCWSIQSRRPSLRFLIPLAVANSHVWAFTAHSRIFSLFLFILFFISLRPTLFAEVSAAFIVWFVIWMGVEGKSWLRLWLIKSHIDTFAIDIFESVVVVFAICGLIEDCSVFGAYSEVNICCLLDDLCFFHASIVKSVHLFI